MKPTNGNVFLDTNVLVYAHTDVDSEKQATAQSLIAESRSFISTQVLQELANTLNRKFKQPWKDIIDVLQNASNNNNIYTNNESTVVKACEIAARYGYSFYDSLVLSAALGSIVPLFILKICTTAS
jgi:predicted nucleic acid-binding protein